MPDLVGHDGHSPEVAGYGTHKVSVTAGSQLSAVLGRTDAAVPTHHHQAIDQLGTGLVATAWTDDTVIEAVQFAPTHPTYPAGPSCLSVHSHPQSPTNPTP